MIATRIPIRIIIIYICYYSIRRHRSHARLTFTYALQNGGGSGGVGVAAAHEARQARLSALTAAASTSDSAAEISLGTSERLSPPPTRANVCSIRGCARRECRWQRSMAAESLLRRAAVVSPRPLPMRYFLWVPKQRSSSSSE